MAALSQYEEYEPPGQDGEHTLYNLEMHGPYGPGAIEHA